MGERNILNHRRSDIDIVHDILTLTQDGVRKTKILYQVNLSYTQLKNYLLFLVSNNFIEEVVKDDNHGPHMTYQATEKGLCFMEDINKVMSHL